MGGAIEQRERALLRHASAGLVEGRHRGKGEEGGSGAWGGGSEGGVQEDEGQAGDCDGAGRRECGETEAALGASSGGASTGRADTVVTIGEVVAAVREGGHSASVGGGTGGRTGGKEGGAMGIGIEEVEGEEAEEGNEKENVEEGRGGKKRDGEREEEEEDKGEEKQEDEGTEGEEEGEEGKEEGEGRAQVWYEVCVADEGVGMEEEELRQVLFMAQAGAQRGGVGGTGLGLAISHGLLALMGGRLWIKSQPSKGTQAFVLLPLLRPSAPFPPSASIPTPHSAKGIPPASPPGAGRRSPSPCLGVGQGEKGRVGEGEREKEDGKGEVGMEVEEGGEEDEEEEEECRSLSVLVAEDNKVNQLLIRKLLKHYGHDVTVVGNGRLAVEAVQKDCYDLVLMDLQMPVLDGLSATREIRKLSGEEARIPVYALTADVLAPEIEAAGMDGFLSKPIAWDKMSSLVDRLLHTKRAKQKQQKQAAAAAAAAAADVGGGVVGLGAKGVEKGAQAEGRKGEKAGGAAAGKELGAEKRTQGAAAGATAEKSGGDGAGGGGGGGKLRVLVAEDNRVNQMLIRKMLQHYGHEVTLVGNGRLAVEAVQEKPFDLVLMDIQMPIMDGLTATRAIRKLPGKEAAIPVYALTADVLAPEIEAAGMDGFLSKPIAWDKMSSVVDKLLQGKKA
ncbi:hypothetical protein CLOM_g12009 [Closterium sp. NIES-68]|nr:hypothetical protein CLOM_g12009 [Closterium sp. NIES-68]